MMKYEETKKITALGVVIFSFAAILLCMIIIVAIDCIAALLVLKTSMPEGFLKIASVIAGGCGVITATAFLTAKGRVKGIISAGIMAASLVLIKVLGSSLLNFGNYLTFSGVIGIAFTIVFAFVGGVVGSALKGR
jgi:hypothetical protein